MRISSVMNKSERIRRDRLVDHQKEDGNRVEGAEDLFIMKDLEEAALSLKNKKALGPDSKALFKILCKRKPY